MLSCNSSFQELVNKAQEEVSKQQEVITAQDNIIKAKYASKIILAIILSWKNLIIFSIKHHLIYYTINTNLLKEKINYKKKKNLDN